MEKKQALALNEPFQLDDKVQFKHVHKHLYADGETEAHNLFFKSCERAFADFINDELKGHNFSSLDRFVSKIEAARTLYGKRHELSGYPHGI